MGDPGREHDSPALTRRGFLGGASVLFATLGRTGPASAAPAGESLAISLSGRRSPPIPVHSE